VSQSAFILHLSRFATLLSQAFQRQNPLISPFLLRIPVILLSHRLFQERVFYLLDVVVAQGAAILQLLASKDKTLLVRGDSLLILDLGFDIVDRVAGLDLKGDGLARQGLDEAVYCRFVSLPFMSLSLAIGGSWA
jgi:hypothetical protein